MGNLIKFLIFAAIIGSFVYGYYALGINNVELCYQTIEGIVENRAETDGALIRELAWKHKVSIMYVMSCGFILLILTIINGLINGTVRLGRWGV